MISAGGRVAKNKAQRTALAENLQSEMASFGEHGLHGGDQERKPKLPPKKKALDL